MSLEGALEVAVTSSSDSSASADSDPSPGSDPGTVAFAFTVRNEGTETVELSFSDAAKAEFVVYENGTERWRFTEGRLFAQLLSRDRLESGEGTTYRGSWEDPEPGTYTAIATLRAEEAECQARSTFTVPA